MTADNFHTPNGNTERDNIVRTGEEDALTMSSFERVVVLGSQLARDSRKDIQFYLWF